jgi:hypothetical protein
MTTGRHDHDLAGRPARNRANERGAILVHVAVLLVGLVGFSVLTIDMGVVWIARTQAQNAADAAALAGAVSMAYADPGDADTASEAALSVAAANPVWNEAPAPAIGSDITTNPCPAGGLPPGDCLQVKVERSAANGNPLPVYFAPLLGVTPADVWARATAQVIPANTTTCLKPWAVPDQWTESAGPGDVFNPPSDQYVAPSATGTGTGFTVSVMFNDESYLSMTGDVAVVRYTAIVPLDLGNLGSGGAGALAYEDNITGCFGNPVSVGDFVPARQYDPTFVGTLSRVQDVLDRGPEPANRVIALALYDPAHYAGPMGPGTLSWGTQLRISNIVGFHLDRIEAGRIVGRVVPAPGLRNTSAPDLVTDSAFLRAVALVR